MTYNGQSYGGSGVATINGNNIRTYNGQPSGGEGILTFKNPYMSKPTFAAILLAKGIIRSGN